MMKWYRIDTRDLRVDPHPVNNDTILSIAACYYTAPFDAIERGRLMAQFAMFVREDCLTAEERGRVEEE